MATTRTLRPWTRTGLPRWSVLPSLLLLASCATVNQAPVVDLSTPGGSEVASGTFAAPASTDPAARPFDTAGRREHVVAAGDTLYGIAFRHGLDFRALAVWNGIAPPFTIQPGQRLRLEPPVQPTVAARTQRTETSRAPVAMQPSAPMPAERSDALAAAPIEPGPEPGSAQTFGIDSAPSNGAALQIESVEPLSAPGAAPDRRVAPPAPADPPGRPLPPANRPPPGSLGALVAGSRPGPDATTPARPVAQASPPQPAPGEPVASAAQVAEPTPAPTAAASAPTAPLPVGPTRTVGKVVWRWPAEGAVIARFSLGDPARQGIDLRGREGAPVVAAGDGEVVYSGNGLVGYGELVIIKHSPEFLSAYGYNRRRLVTEGQRVRAGQQIAEMGKANANLDILHFEIRRAGKPVDPLQILPRR